MSGGRPRIFADKAKVTALLNAIRLGLSRSTAAKIVGCSVTSIADEARRNNGFSEALKEAEGACEQALVAYIYTAAKKGQWTAAAWLLERKFKRWGPPPRRIIEQKADAVDLNVREDGG